MSLYLQASRADQRRIRREMLKQAESLLKATGAKDWKFVARQLVDSSLAKEKKDGDIEGSNAQRLTIQ